MKIRKTGHIENTCIMESLIILELMFTMWEQK